MSSQYKENNFSPESSPASRTFTSNKISKPNIDHLKKRIVNENKRQNKINIITIGIILLSASLIFYFFQN